MLSLNSTAPPKAILSQVSVSGSYFAQAPELIMHNPAVE